jgi:hypothetical protein
MLDLKKNHYEESSSPTPVSMVLRDCVAEESRTPRKASNSIQQEEENIEREREREREREQSISDRNIPRQKKKIRCIETNENRHQEGETIAEFGCLIVTRNETRARKYTAGISWQSENAGPPTVGVTPSRPCTAESWKKICTLRCLQAGEYGDKFGGTTP